MSNRRAKTFFIALLALTAAAGFLVFVSPVFAQPDLGLQQIEGDIGLPATDIRTIAARIIRAALGLLGIVALGLILWGGYVWMTAGGDEDRIAQAKKILVNAVIGLIIILSAYAIVSFVISKLLSATTGLPEHCFNQQQDEGETGIDCGGECSACGGGGGGGGAGTVFYVASKPPADLGCGSRNVKPTVFFNQRVNLETISGNLVLRKKDNGEAAAGAWSYLASNRQNAAVFTPSGDCGDGGPAECLEANAAYELVFVKPSAIKSQTNLVLNCLFGAKCEPPVVFSTGASVDRTPPNVRISAPADGSRLPQGQVVPISVSWSDDFGLQNVSVYTNDTYISGLSLTGCQKSGQSFFNWPTAGFATGTYRLDAIALDGGNQGMGSSNVLLLPGHCFDNNLNEGETQAGPPACGDGCGSCAGQTCDSDDDCASGYCEIPEGQTEGVCVDRMQITYVSPPSGAPATIVSVAGKFFGDEPGRVFFTSKNGGWIAAPLVNCASGFDSWTPSQIVTEVPSDAADGPLKVETASIVGPDNKTRRFTDTTNDDWGGLKNFSFDVNEIKRPGLCAIVPSSGQPFDSVTFIGRNFYPVYDPDHQIFEFDTTVAAALPLSWKVEPFTGLSSAVVKVPYLPQGVVGARTNVGVLESNVLRFGIGVVSDASRPMILSITPEEGARGEYITVEGRNFGAIRGKILFKKDGEDTALYGSFDFPEACKTSVWNDKRILVKFPSSASEVGRYSVQVENAVGVKSPISEFFALKAGASAPGICRLEPAAGPMPLPSGGIFEINGEHFTGADDNPIAYFWQAGAAPESLNGRNVAPTLEINRTVGKEKIITGSPTRADTGPVVVGRDDGRFSNPLNFAVYDCLGHNFSCSDYPGTTCCQDGPQAGQCRQSCEAGQRATGYLWRFSTRDVPLVPQVIERCDSNTENGNAIPTPAPNVLNDKGGNTDGSNVCRSAVVTVAFNIQMKQATVNANSFKIWECKSGSVTGNNCIYETEVALAGPSYILRTALWDWTGGEFYLLASPSANGGQWEDDTWYQVVLDKGITSNAGIALKPSRPCGGNSAYCFVFRTDARQCRLRAVVVTPLDYWTSILEKPIRHRQDQTNADDPGEQLSWRGNGLSDQRCIWMSMSEYDWDWGVSDMTRAEIFSAEGNEAQVSALTNTVSVGLPNDAVMVQATAVRPLPGDSTALDQSGRGHNAALGVGTFITDNGKFGQAVGFDGTTGANSGVNAGHGGDFEFGTGPFAVVAWVKTNSFRIGAVFSKPTVWAKTGAPGWGLAWAGSPEFLYLNAGNGSNYSLYRFENSRVFSEWTQLGMMRDDSGKLFAIRNGQIIDTGVSLAGDVSNESRDLLIGKNSWTGGVIDGYIDEARVYRRVLAAGEVSQLYNLSPDELNQNIALKNNLVGYWTFDQDTIGGSLESKTGDSSLHIDLSKPRVVDYWPNCLEACPNAAIGAKFNLLMANGNISLPGYNLNQAIHLYKCFDENCLSAQEIRNITPVFSASDRRLLSIGLLPLGRELATGTLYKVVLSVTGTSTADGGRQLWSSNSSTEDSIPGRPMQEEFSWRFRTKAQDCVIDRVAVAPAVYRAGHYDDKAVFSAEPYSAPDACEPKGQRLDPWSVDWRWSSSDEKVATIKTFSTKGQNNFCTAECLKKGSAIAYGEQITEPLCGNNKIEAGEDCDPPSAVTHCGLNCLALGNAPATDPPIGKYCGDGLISTELGETCDPPSATSSCGADCLRLGSKASPGPGETLASICGNGFIGLGEDCDLGIAPNRLVSTSSMHCSSKCLHLGTTLSASWCQAAAVLKQNFAGFSQSDFTAACADAISICGDGVVGPDEHAVCEPGAGKTLPSNCSKNCLRNDRCEPYETITLATGEKVTRRREGCSENGQLLGSSLFYSTPSVCGDKVVGIGEEIACENGIIVTHTFINPWALVTGLGRGVVGGEPPAQRTNIIATSIKDERAKTGQGVFELVCGHKTDDDCAAADPNCADDSCGVARDTCCYPRPLLISAYPEKTTPPKFNVCPNTEIKLVFDKKIDPNTLRGNIIVARGSQTAATSCPAGDNVTHLIESGGSGFSGRGLTWYRRLWDKTVAWVKNLISLKSAEAVKETVNSNLWCAGEVLGEPEVVYDDLSPETNTTSTIYIRLKKPLATSTDFAIVLRPDLRDIKGVSVGSKIQWKFITADKICELTSLNIDPSEKVFRAVGEKEDFYASALAQNGQAIQPVDGYRWEYVWQPMTNDYVTLTDTVESINQVAAKNRNGELDLLAKTRFTENSYFDTSPELTARAKLTVYICERPWPSIENWPFRDSEYDFTFHYCMDSGGAGPADDLPDLKIARQDRRADEKYLRRYFLTTPDNPDAVGVQIFPNPEHLSVEDWYRAQGFGGSFQRLKIDGYDAISDGNNVYVDALNFNQNLLFDPPQEKFWSNIYLFSLSGGASADLRRVFEQLLANLKFNSNLENTGYCGSQFTPPDPDLNRVCSSDLDCAATADNLCLNQKDKVQRNYRRLKDLRLTADALDAFGAAKEAAGVLSYPLVKNNTYLANQALSAWTSSWQEFSSALSVTAPTDPINRLGPAGTCSTEASKACLEDSTCASIPTSGRVSYWPADNSLADEYSASTSLKQSGSLGYSAGKGHGQAFDFNGEAGAYLSVDDQAQYNSDNFTVSFMFYPRKRNTAILMKKGGADGDGIGRGGWQIEYSGWSFAGQTPVFNNGTLRFAIFAAGTKQYYALDTAAPLVLNQWHRLTVAFTKASGIKIFLNEQLVSGSKDAGNIKNENQTPITNNNVLQIIANAEPIIIGQNFNGLIDNIAFYNRALSNGEGWNLLKGLCVIHDATTGWSAEDRRFSFACNSESLAYRYLTGGSGDDAYYVLRAKSERTDLSAWNAFSSEMLGDRFGENIFTDSVCLAGDEVSSPYSVVCGDGLLGGEEKCDPPGETIYDSSNCPDSKAKKQVCGANCQLGRPEDVECREAAGGSCGDGKVQPVAGEVCDDGKLNGQTGRCASDCLSIKTECQNGALNNELCDPSINRNGKRGWCVGGPYYFDLKKSESYLPCNSNSECQTGYCHIADDLYGLLSAYSCGWDCQSRGPFCGDGVVEGEWGEMCETDEPCIIGGKSGQKKCTNCRYDNTDIPGLVSFWGFDYIKEPEGWIYDAKAGSDYVSGECRVKIGSKTAPLTNVCPTIVPGKHEGNMGFDFKNQKAIMVDDDSAKYFHKTFTTEAWVKPANVSHGSAERVWEKGGFKASPRGGFGLEFNKPPDNTDVCKQQVWNGGPSVDCDNISSAAERSKFYGNFRCLAWIPSDSAYAKQYNSIGFFAADTFSVSLDEWHHIACVFDGVPVVDADRPDIPMYAGVLKAYVDGKLVSVNNYARMASTTAPICMGRRCVKSGTEFVLDSGGPTPFNGTIEDVAYYSRALSADELKQHYDGEGWYCSAFLPLIPQTGCGNRVVEEDEACDEGVLQNGIPCLPVPPNKNCTYCSADCRNVLTADTVCGNGVLDILAFESCDINDPLSGGPWRWPTKTEYLGQEVYVDMCYTCKACVANWKGTNNALLPDFNPACVNAGKGYCGDGIKNGWEQCDASGAAGVKCSVVKSGIMMNGTCDKWQCVCTDLSGMIINPPGEEEGGEIIPD